ncbi:MAG: SusC/RagA family TonB-linked outer membrane protein [Prevotella sp.]|jgi:TonB-linked SusC/RagA family outer membrane protein
MKIYRLIFVVLLGIFMQALHAASKEPLTITFNNEELSSVFKRLEKQTSYMFLFAYDDVSGYRVEGKLHDASFVQVMDYILMNTPLTYKIEDKIVTVFLKRTPQNQQKEKTISGRVLARDDGEPVIGATVMIVGSKLGTVTDANGRFRLEQSPEGVQLRITYLGMKPEIVNASTRGDIYLSSTSKALDKVVVTGIFRKNRESFTGAVSVIDQKQLKNFKGRDIITTLKNIDPTFNVLENNNFGGDPNHLATVQIRGTSSLPTVQDLKNETRVDLNTPLIILDGVEISLSRMRDLNDEDVNSVTILKDGSATAIYGSRGANGVVVIESRKPEVGKLRLSYRAGLNIEAPDLTGYDVLNAREKLQLEKDAGLYENVFANAEMALRERYNKVLEDVERGVDTYWLSKPLHTGVGNRHNLRLEGGSEDGFRYAVSLQSNDIRGVMKGSKRQNFTGGIDLMYERKNLLFTNNLTISQTISNESPYGSFRDYVNLNPYWTERDENGQIRRELEPRNDHFFNPAPENPLYNATLDVVNKQKNFVVFNNFNLEWHPFKNFIARARFGISKQVNRSDLFKPAQHTDFKDYTDDEIFRKGRYQYGTGNDHAYDLSVTLNYSHRFNEKHSLFAGLNYNLAEQSSEAYTFVMEGFPQPNFKMLSMALQYEEKGKPGGTDMLNRRIGITGNLNYIYDDKYFADVAYRLDGASQFGKNKRFAPFYSLGAGWNIHKEKFLSGLEWLDRLKIRGSYAVTGAVNFSPYQALATYDYYMDDRYRYWFGTHLMGLANEDLEWQRTYKWNVGFELGLLDNRLTFTTDFYHNTTDNLLSEMNIPLANGFPSYTANVGKVRNQGVELSVMAYLLHTKDINWSISASMIHEQNKIVRISDALKEANKELEKEGGSNPNFLYREGEALRTIYVVPSYGIDPSTGRELYRDRMGNATYRWNAADRVACGVEDPKIRGNINTMFSYKDVTLTMSFGYRMGGDIYNSTLVDRIENADLRYNVDRRVYEERWRQPGDHTFFKDIRDRQTTRMSSRFVQRENLLECQNMQIRYNLPKSWITRLGIQNVSTAFSTDNLFRLSTIKQERGLYYPFSHRYSFSLSVIF